MLHNVQTKEDLFIKKWRHLAVSLSSAQNAAHSCERVPFLALLGGEKPWYNGNFRALSICAQFWKLFILNKFRNNVYIFDLKQVFFSSPHISFM